MRGLNLPGHSGIALFCALLDMLAVEDEMKPVKTPLSTLRDRHWLTAAYREEKSAPTWYAGRMRHGYRPHPRHWRAFSEFVGVSPALQIGLGRATDS